MVVHRDGGTVEWRIERPLLSMHDLPPLLALSGMVAWVSALAVPIKRWIGALYDMLHSVRGRPDTVSLCASSTLA